MNRLQLDAEQRFTCRSCGRCCRTDWQVPVLPQEAADYQASRAGRWFRSGDAGATTGDEREARWLDRQSLPLLCKRPDGACGFLSEEGRCRLHEELGGPRKPLACRVFPYRFHAVEDRVIVTASFSCPTVARNEGATLPQQERDLRQLADQWLRAFPAPPRDLAFLKGRPLEAPTLRVIQDVLLEMLGRAGPSGEASDLRANVARMRAFVEDL
jgi:lysine-N-methylase